MASVLSKHPALEMERNLGACMPSLMKETWRWLNLQSMDPPMASVEGKEVHSLYQ